MFVSGFYFFLLIYKGSIKTKLLFFKSLKIFKQIIDCSKLNKEMNKPSIKLTRSMTFSWLWCHLLVQINFCYETFENTEYILCDKVKYINCIKR